MATPSSQSFGPTSGLLTGWFASALLAAGGVAMVFGDSLAWGALLLAVALLVWSFLARPRVVLGDGTLELRNAFSSWLVPVGRVDDVEVRHGTVVTVGDDTYVGDAVGLTSLDVLGRREPGRVPAQVIEAIEREKARAKAASGEVSRVYAVPQLVALGVLVLLFVVLEVF